jgi:hypothetical protein
MTNPVFNKNLADRLIYSEMFDNRSITKCFNGCNVIYAKIWKVSMCSPGDKLLA